MKEILILGSTGSIGLSTLSVIKSLPEKFKVKGLAADSNTALLHSQIKEFYPKFVCINDPRKARDLKAKIGNLCTVYSQEDGLLEAIAKEKFDKVMVAMSGSSALKPLLMAIENTKEIALANKEALVMAGEIITAKANKFKVNLIPVDSEQSAIWQCLKDEDRQRVKTIYLTGSGGPLRGKRAFKSKDLTVSKIIKHPRWKMGKKISVDSATLMNKGLEILETMHLFGLAFEKIKVVIHPQALVHSLVEFVDGIILAQLSAADMRLPIHFALNFPQRIPNSFPRLDFFKLKNLSFEKPDLKRFPCLSLAYTAAKEMGTLPCVLNASNEVCVNAFLSGKINFTLIPKLIEKVFRLHKNHKVINLDSVLEADRWARNETNNLINYLRLER